MDNIAKELSNELYWKAKSLSAEDRIVVGVAGIPASGKTTLAYLVVKYLNVLSGEGSTEPNAEPFEISALVGLDGWHLTRAQLSQMDDPQRAFDRRGIHWTFDPASYLSFVKLLKEPISPTSPIIRAPSFDHALKDPTPDAISILPSHKIVVIEGLYVLLSVDRWREAAELLDERWLVEVDLEVAKSRLVKRHVVTGVAKGEKEAIWRAQENDMPNGSFLLTNMITPSKRIQSLDDPSVLS